MSEPSNLPPGCTDADIEHNASGNGQCLNCDQPCKPGSDFCSKSCAKEYNEDEK